MGNSHTYMKMKLRRRKYLKFTGEGGRERGQEEWSERREDVQYLILRKKAKWQFFTSRVPKLRYGDVIHSFDWKSAVEHDGGV